jgi:hypothetical protein
MILGRVAVLRWLTRVWRCLEPDCATTAFTEQHPIAPPRAILTVRAVRWATWRALLHHLLAVPQAPPGLHATVGAVVDIPNAYRARVRLDSKQALVFGGRRPRRRS